MESTLESSVDSKEVIGGLETNFVIAKSGSANNSNGPNGSSFENNQTEVDSFQPNTNHGNNSSKNGKMEVSNITESKNSEVHNSTGSYSPKGSILKNEELEAKDSIKKPIIKSVSFRDKDHEVSEYSLSMQSYISHGKSVTDYNALQSSTSINSMITGTSSGKNIPVLENIPEVDENISEADEAPGYYGWDGYEARFEESMSDYASWSSMPGCIPPWAKSVRKRYGLSPMESLDEGQIGESKGTMQEKLENLMKKHKELMLLKRVESKKQLIIEPNKDPNEMDAVKMRAKSTRYYMTPLVFDGAKETTDDHIDDKDKVSLPSLSDSNSLSITKKTSRPQAKKEISQVLKSLQKQVSKKKDDKRDHEYKIKKENDKCPKITLSNIREFVNMSPDERKLHEIIKIEKVPSVQDINQRNKPSSKYTINVPKNTINDIPTVNVIKIKEKRKLKVDGIENIEEKVTELRYNQGGTTRPAKRESDPIYRESADIDPRRHIKTRTKSPTETKTFEVKTRHTPLLAPLINEEDKKTEKVLLLQYDKKSKNNKNTTQLVGFKEPCTTVSGEMYLYGSEIEGKKVKENLAAVRELPVTLKDKVHSIFEELRGLTLKQNVKEDIPLAEVRPSVAKTTQRQSHFPASTKVAMVAAKPELKSVAVQVRESKVLQGKSDSFVLVTPHPTPTSEFQSGQEEIQSSLNNDTLNTKLEDLVQDKASLEKPTLSIDEVRKDEREIEQESSQVLPKQEVIEEDKSIIGEENKIELTKQEEPVNEAKNEEDKTELEDENKVDDHDQTADVPEIPGTVISDQEIEGKEIIPDDDTKETTVNKVQEDTHSEPIEDMPKELSMEKSKESLEKSIESIEQHKEEMQILPVENETKKLSKPSPKFSEQASILQPPQDKYFETTKRDSNAEIRMSSKKSDDETDMYFKTSFPKEFEDIRSYEFGSQQGTELVIKSSSKFLHQKDGLRKSKYKVGNTFYDSFQVFLINIFNILILA